MHVDIVVSWLKINTLFCEFYQMNAIFPITDALEYVVTRLI